MTDEPKYIRKYGLSPSMINDFEGCPARFKGKSIDRDPRAKFVETESSKWGNEVHTMLENHVKHGTELPSYLAHMGKFIASLRDAGYKLLAELPMSVNAQWKAVGWWAKDHYVRGKADLFAIKPDEREAIFVDYKTGKRKNDPSQLNLYGTMALSALGLTKVSSWFMWLKTKETDKVTVDQSNVQILRNQFASRISVIDDAYKTGNFPTKPSPLCAWCPFLQTCDGGVLYRKRARFMKGNR
jgi:RecB family exonuclease